MFYFEDDFVEVSGNRSSHENSVLMDEVPEILSREVAISSQKTTTTTIPSSSSQANDIEQLRRINEAFNEESNEIVLDDKNDDVVNQDLFKEVSSLVRGGVNQPAQVDYSTISSNRIERYVIEDAKHLLRMFGLPYVDSPGEAEAQCAYVNFSKA